jgi:hypothetical protein
LDCPDCRDEAFDIDAVAVRDGSHLFLLPMRSGAALVESMGSDGLPDELIPGASEGIIEPPSTSEVEWLTAAE